MVSCPEQAVIQSEGTFKVARRRYGTHYAPTIHAALAFIRCLLSELGPGDVETANEILVTIIKETKASQRLGEKGTDGQEIILQCAIIAKQHPAYTTKDITYYAGEIRKVVGTLRATHTPNHATTIRATAEYLMYFARDNNQEARR